MARSLTGLVVVALLAVSGASHAGAQQTPKRGGTVIYGGPFGEPACLAPFREACDTGASRLARGRILSKVLEAPFDVGPDYTWRKRLVSDVDYTRKPPFTLTYHIRPEASWSDGTPITAADFVFTHQALLKLGSPDHVNRTEVRSVRALDRKTLSVVLRSRFAGWRGLFGSILPSHALQGVSLSELWIDRIDNPKTGTPIGSGPFLVESWERGKRLTLVRNNRYWGSHVANLDRLVVRFQVQATTLLDAFRSGELDIAAGGYAPDLLADVAGQVPGVKVVGIRRSAGWDHLEIRIGDGGHPAFGSKLVRHALAYGIDRAALAREAHTVSLLQQDSLVFAKSTPHYQANWSTYAYRPSESVRLLEQAGCRRGSDGIYICAGEPLRLRFVSTAGVIRVPVLGLLQKQLRQVGIEVRPIFASSQVLFGQILPSGDFDVALFGWVHPPDAAADLKGIFGCAGRDNYTGYCQRLVTADLDQAVRILDADRQARVLNRADLQMAKDVPEIPLYLLPQNVALRSTVRNFGFALNSVLNELWNAEDWWLDR